MMRTAIPVLTVLALLGCLGFLLFARSNSRHALTLYAYFQHVQDVQKGMPVCVDGVQLGSVASVTVRPELGDHPVEVALQLTPSYKLKIPAGSTAQVVGMLHRVVDIDTRTANGPPLTTESRIEGRESTDDQATHALGVIVKALVNESNIKANTQPRTPGGNPKIDHGH